MSEKIETLHAVYTAGKAATTTTHRTLSEYVPGRIYDIRRASKEGVAEFKEFVRGHFDGQPLRTDDIEFESIRKENPEAHLALVSLTREPVAACISAWFFHFGKNYPGVDPSDWSTDKHRDAIVDGGYASRRDFFTNWFDFECRAFTGIDVLGTGFPIDKGYETYASEKADLLVIRSEDLNRVYQPAFQEFLGVQVGKLIDHHVGEDSSYADAYKRFKAQAVFPESFLDEQHNTDFAQTFYSPEEIEASHAQWTRAS